MAVLPITLFFVVVNVRPATGFVATLASDAVSILQARVFDLAALDFIPVVALDLIENPLRPFVGAGFAFVTDLFFLVSNLVFVVFLVFLPLTVLVANLGFVLFFLVFRPRTLLVQRIVVAVDALDHVRRAHPGRSPWSFVLVFDLLLVVEMGLSRRHFDRGWATQQLAGRLPNHRLAGPAENQPDEDADGAPGHQPESRPGSDQRLQGCRRRRHRTLASHEVLPFENARDGLVEGVGDLDDRRVGGLDPEPTDAQPEHEAGILRLERLHHPLTGPGEPFEVLEPLLTGQQA